MQLSGCEGLIRGGSRKPTQLKKRLRIDSPAIVGAEEGITAIPSSVLSHPFTPFLLSELLSLVSVRLFRLPFFIKFVYIL